MGDVTAADIATWGTAGGTLFLAAVTAILAWQTKNIADQNRKMVEEVRNEREERERPRVLVYVDYGQLPMLYLVIHNVGGSPAAQVTFTSRPALMQVRTEGGEAEEADLLHEVNSKFGPGPGIKVLPPGAKISLWWGRADALAEHYKSSPGGDQPFEGRVRYRSLTTEGTPSEDERYDDVFSLNPFVVGRLNRPPEGQAAPRS